MCKEKSKQDDPFRCIETFSKQAKADRESHSGRCNKQKALLDSQCPTFKGTALFQTLSRTTVAAATTNLAPYPVHISVDYPEQAKPKKQVEACRGKKEDEFLFQ